MRIATFIIGLIVTGAIFLQSCLVYGLGSVGKSLGSEEAGTAASGGAGGILVAILAFLAMAFVLRLPTVSLVLYLIAALFAFASAAMNFGDMTIWGAVMLVLAVMSFFARRELRKDRGKERGTQSSGIAG